jgi:hypothetical protein
VNDLELGTARLAVPDDVLGTTAEEPEEEAASGLFHEPPE